VVLDQADLVLDSIRQLEVDAVAALGA
jgi:hypothetical protein